MNSITRLLLLKPFQLQNGQKTYLSQFLKKFSINKELPWTYEIKILSTTINPCTNKACGQITPSSIMPELFQSGLIHISWNQTVNFVLSCSINWKARNPNSTSFPLNHENQKPGTGIISLNKLNLRTRKASSLKLYILRKD